MNKLFDIVDKKNINVTKDIVYVFINNVEQLDVKLHKILVEKLFRVSIVVKVLKDHFQNSVTIVYIGNVVGSDKKLNIEIDIFIRKVV